MAFRELDKGFRQLAKSPVPIFDAEVKQIEKVVEKVNEKPHMEPQVVEKVRTEVVRVEVPSNETIDYEKLAKVIKDNMKISVYGGSSIQHMVNARDIAVNPATEEGQQEIINALGGTYFYQEADEGATYNYYGYASSTGWKIMREVISTGRFGYVSGDGGYDTAWGLRADKEYSNTP